MRARVRPDKLGGLWSPPAVSYPLYMSLKRKGCSLLPALIYGVIRAAPLVRERDLMCRGGCCAVSTVYWSARATLG